MGRFEEHVRRALDSLPPELAKRLENVAVVVEDENPDDPDLFGLFQEEPYLPAKISIYRLPLEESFSGLELEREIRVTVLHELAHYFGIDEDRLAAWPAQRAGVVAVLQDVVVDPAAGELPEPDDEVRDDQADRDDREAARRDVVAKREH